MSREPMRLEPPASGTGVPTPEGPTFEPATTERADRGLSYGSGEAIALRAAVRRVAPDALSTFDIQHRYAHDPDSRNGAPARMRMFLHRWGVFVQLRSCPRRAARLALLERAAAEATDTETARAAAQEIARILDGPAHRAFVP